MPLKPLAVAAESLHWMNCERVFVKLRHWLKPEGLLAIVTERGLMGLPWAAELAQLLARYSTNRDYRPYDIVDELSRRGLFLESGRAEAESPFTQDVSSYVESFHSRNGFSRERMEPTAAAAFDRAVRASWTRASNSAAVGKRGASAASAANSATAAAYSASSMRSRSRTAVDGDSRSESTAVAICLARRPIPFWSVAAQAGRPADHASVSSWRISSTSPIAPPNRSRSSRSSRSAPSD